MTTTENGVLAGRIRLRQPSRGYRAGMDAALLAAACDAADGARVLDVGCGPGAVMLAAAIRRPRTLFTGLERDPAAVALARDNVIANALQDRVTVIEGDLATRLSAIGQPPFDAALANPPFFDDDRTLRAPGPEKHGAWITTEGLAAWTAFLIKSVRVGGTITLIHRADRLADILASLAPKAGSLQILPIHPHADVPAKRVLVRAIKTGKAPLLLLPPLVLHERDGAKHSAAAEAILRGEATLGWA